MPTGEPAAGLAVVRSPAQPMGLQAVDDAAVVNYHGFSPKLRDHGVPAEVCYFRWVSAASTVSGTFLPDPRSCWLVAGPGRTYLAIDPNRPLTQSLDVSDLAHPVPVAWEPAPHAVERGDVALGQCVDLLTNWVDVPGACAYSPRRHQIYHADRTGLLAVDARGRVWSMDDARTVTVTDGDQTRRSSPLPARPQQDSLVISGDRAAFWTAGAQARLYLTADAGAHWREANVPVDVKDSLSPVTFLPDGRLLFTAQDLESQTGAGYLYRAKSAANTAFEQLPAGPLEQIVVAGDLVYGASAGGADPTVSERVWVSANAGATWRPLVDGDLALGPEPALAADQLTQIPTSEAHQIIEHSLKPSAAALGTDGQLLIGYSDPSGARSGWRLFDRHNRMLGEGLDAGARDPQRAGNGFVLGGSTYIGPDGKSDPVDASETAQPPVAGDVYLRGYGMFRASGRELFRGAASPTGAVSAQDTLGRLWALAPKQHGRTVVRSALAGGPWSTRDLGPGIGAKQVQGRESTLMVAGRTQMYLSIDAGRSWRLVAHHATEYAGGPPTFTVLPNGTIVGGDDRGGEGVSTDGRSFHALGPYQGLRWSTLGDDLFRRTVKGRVEISRDRVHWRAFSLDTVRALVRAPSK